MFQIENVSLGFYVTGAFWSLLCTALCLAIQDIHWLPQPNMPRKHSYWILSTMLFLFSLMELFFFAAEDVQRHFSTEFRAISIAVMSVPPILFNLHAHLKYRLKSENGDTSIDR
ncbi:MAG: hypothetical protein RL196_1309 [Actinomycetota bacterium]|jgi:hypothetical protein